MLLYASGKSLVEKDEFFEMAAKGKVPKAQAFADALRTPGQKPSEAKRLTTPGTGGTAPAVVPFKPIGMGKPLTIMIHQIHTGKYPEGAFGTPGRADMLVTSAVKSVASYDAKPRALNYLKAQVKRNEDVFRPQAVSHGTPIVFYSPSLVDISLTLDLAIVFENFPKELFDKVSATLQSLAGIPVFLPYTTCILGISGIVKLAGGLGDKLFNGKPAFLISDPLDFELPGSKPFPSGFALVTDHNVDESEPSFLEKYHVDEAGQVVDPKGAKYRGDMPFMVISLDGTEHGELKSFTPTAVSAAVLARFYGAQEGGPGNLDILLEGVKLSNDMYYRKQVDDLDKQLLKMSDDDPQKKEITAKRDAWSKNILTDLLKKS